MLINPLTFLPIAKVAALPLLAATVAVSCTAAHYTRKIERIDITHKNERLLAENEMLALMDERNKITVEVQNVIEKSKSAIAASYANGAAAERLRIKAESARAVRALPKPTVVPAGAAPSDGLSGGSGEANSVAFAQQAQEPYYLSMPAVETAGLLEQCDINTNKLVNLQLWVNEQLKAGEKK